MSQDTRKDPRAKVLTMTVRYKSATLDEFIEHHSYDVSRGGMFIKTPSPFPPGTLLKFEVKIAADQKVIQGVGRVVWKRDSETHGDARPAGMGVKFIKIDDASRKVIDALVESRGDASSAYEAGGGDTGQVPTPAPAAAAMSSKAPGVLGEPPKMPSARKQTMIGLGAMNPSNRPPVVAPVADKPVPSFFPDTKSEADMPAPEDRTVMKQARELLQDALAQTGSSMEEVAAPPKYADPPAAPVSAGQPPAAAVSTTPRSEPPSKGPASVPAEPKPVSARPAASARPASSASAAQKAATVPAARKSAVSAAPASRRVSVPAAAPVENSGGGRIILIVVAIAAAAGVAFALSKSSPPSPAPSASAEPAPAASLAPPAASASAVPVDSASAAPPESAASPASAAPQPEAAPSAAPAKPVVAVPVVPAPKPVPVPVLPAKPVLQQRPAPKPAAAKPPSEPSEPAAPVTPAAPTAEKPAPAPVAPKPKPAEPAGDNPY